MSELIIPSAIFNVDKSDYEDPKPIFRQQGGLLDSINKHHEDQWIRYKTLKQGDWDENDWNYASRAQDFVKCGAVERTAMIRTLAYQWETDTVVSRIITQVISSIGMADELAIGYKQISTNEDVHALTYSEIVRQSFDNPSEVMQDILAVKDSLERLAVVGRVFEDARVAALNYALDPSCYDQTLYNKIFMFFVALYFLERVQFMASFAITFNLCDSTGMFQPVGSGIQKIAQDELYVHVPYNRRMIHILMGTEEGRIAYEQCKLMIVALLNEIVAQEKTWNGYVFEGGEVELVGLNRQSADVFVDFNATDAAYALGIQNEVDFDTSLTTSPLGYMANWVTIDKVQRSPQEEDNGNYKVNVVERDDEEVIFDI